MKVKVNKFWCWYARHIAGTVEGTIDPDGTEYINIGYVEFSVAFAVVAMLCILFVVILK